MTLDIDIPAYLHNYRKRCFVIVTKCEQTTPPSWSTVWVPTGSIVHRCPCSVSWNWQLMSFSTKKDENTVVQLPQFVHMCVFVCVIMVKMLFVVNVVELYSGGMDGEVVEWMDEGVGGSWVGE